MKIIYTNISPVTKSYTNINHIYYLKKQNPKKVYLCVWDNFVFEHPVFEKGLDHTTNKVQKLQENTEILEKLMNHLNLDYKIIYLSEAMDRLLKNSEYSKMLHKILSKIKIEDLNKGSEIDYIPFNQISFSKINYIIADYLISMYLPELFPELCSTAPNFYLTSERFRVFSKKIDDYLSTTYSKYEPPKPIFVKRVPVIIHPEKEEIPSIEMSQEKIKSIVEEYFKEKRISNTEINDLFDVLGEVLGKLEKPKIKRQSIELISKHFYDYFSKISKIIQKENAKERTKSLFISERKEFEKKIKPLNSIKLKILSYCDGNCTSLDISRKTGIKLSTISTYFSYLKNQELITNDRKPKRTADSIVINLKDMA